MKKVTLAFMLSALAALITAVACQPSRPDNQKISVEAPFDMPDITVPSFSQRTFSITDFGATTDTAHLCTQAIAAAIRACNEVGGGTVEVPAGEWHTGPIHLKSNVNLHLSEGAVLKFTDDPQAYLPAVPTSWEGMECYNYSPLIYAYECENVAITGTGTISPKMKTWRGWFGRPQPHLDALKKLYTMASTDVPVEERQMAEGENHLRPHLIQFNRCKNVLLDSFKIRESPFWTIHLYMCQSGVARNLDVKAHGHNNDGIDIEMTRDFLVENCIFDQGDDAVVIKAGRNQDAWRLGTPSENIVVRNCEIRAGHTFLGVGSEMSGGVRNVYMHDCSAPSTVHRFCFLKTNHRRGGFIENIYMKNVKAAGAISVLEIDTDVLYQWRNLVPTYEEKLTKISGIHLDDIDVTEAKRIFELKGDARLPITDITLNNVHVGCVADTLNRVENVEGLETINVVYDYVDAEILPQLNKYISNK